MGFRVWGLGFGVWGLGFGVEGLESEVARWRTLRGSGSGLRGFALQKEPLD